MKSSKKKKNNIRLIGIGCLMMKGDSFSVRSSPTEEFLGSSEVTLQLCHSCRAPHTSEELAIPVETLLSL